MSKLAEIAARSASRMRTVSHWDGQSLGTVIESVDTVVRARAEDAAQAESAEQDKVNAERTTFRAEVFAAPHLMPVNGGEVHYGTPESYGNTDLPICRQSHGYHRISYYRPVNMPVTCTICIGRYGTEA